MIKKKKKKERKKEISSGRNAEAEAKKKAVNAEQSKIKSTNGKHSPGAVMLMILRKTNKNHQFLITIY